MLIALRKKLGFAASPVNVTSLVTLDEFRVRAFSFNKEIQQYWSRILSLSSSLAISQDGELRQILLAIGASQGMRRNGTQHIEPVPESKKSWWNCFHTLTNLLSSFHMGLTAKVLSICPGLQLQWQLLSGLRFILCEQQLHLQKPLLVKITSSWSEQRISHFYISCGNFQVTVFVAGKHKFQHYTEQITTSFILCASSLLTLPRKFCLMLKSNCD